MLDSLLLRLAREAALPAGGALAVDRLRFAQSVTDAIAGHPRIRLRREEARSVPDGLVVVASGPLTSAALADNLSRITGEEYLYFYDAISPTIDAESIDRNIVFAGSRYGRGQVQEGDYLNCPMNREEYEAFIDELLAAERHLPRPFEAQVLKGVRSPGAAWFEGCLPVEVLASRGRQTLAFGPLRPVGLRDPRTGRRPYAVVQLRRENASGTLYSLVGFQTTLTQRAQGEVFRRIPGLGSARFVRFGQMHRNTFLNAPRLMRPTLQLRWRDDLLLAGQIIGVEGYLGNIATGALAGLNAARISTGRTPIDLPRTTMLGALIHQITTADAAMFQPVKAALGLLEPLASPPTQARARSLAYGDRSRTTLRQRLLSEQDIFPA